MCFSFVTVTLLLEEKNGEAEGALPLVASPSKHWPLSRSISHVRSIRLLSRSRGRRLAFLSLNRSDVYRAVYRRCIGRIPWKNVPPSPVLGHLVSACHAYIPRRAIALPLQRFVTRAIHLVAARVSFRSSSPLLTLNHHDLVFSTITSPPLFSSSPWPLILLQTVWSYFVIKLESSCLACRVSFLFFYVRTVRLNSH